MSIWLWTEARAGEGCVPAARAVNVVMDVVSRAAVARLVDRMHASTSRGCLKAEATVRASHGGPATALPGPDPIVAHPETPCVRTSDRTAGGAARGLAAGP